MSSAIDQSCSARNTCVLWMDNNPTFVNYIATLFAREGLDLAIEHGELELAIVTLPPEPSERLELRKVWLDQLHFVVAEDHPLARMRKPELKDLARYPAVLAAKGTYTREIMEKAMHPLDLSLKVGMATNYLETLKMMTSIGLGWSLLPATMSRQGDLKRLHLPGMDLTRSLGVVQHRGRTLSNAARVMREICLGHADPAR